MSLFGWIAIVYGVLVTLALLSACRHIAQKNREADQSRTQNIEDLRLQTTLKGKDLEEAMLNLEYRRAMEAAKAAGENLSLVKEEFELRGKALDLEWAEKNKQVLGTAGTFNAAAMLGLQAGGVDDRIAAATEKTAKELAGLRGDFRNKPAFT